MERETTQDILVEKTRKKSSSISIKFIDEDCEDISYTPTLITPFILPHSPILNKINSLDDVVPVLFNSSSTDVKKKKTERKGWMRYIGILLAMTSCLTFSLCIVIVKYLGAKISPSSFGVYRFSGILCSIPILLYYRIVKKSDVFGSVWPLTLKHKDNIKAVAALTFRGIGGCTAILLQFYAVTYISIASATTIAFSTPIFVTLIAWIFLGEKCGVIPVIAALVTLVGVVITARLIPGSDTTFDVNSDNLIGSAFAFCSMAFATGVFVVLRYLRRVHFSVVTSTFGIVGIIESAILCVVVGRFDIPESAWEWLLVIALALLTLFSQTLMTGALKFEDAGPIALVRTLDVVFSFIWQYVFLDVMPDIYSGIGALVVCLGVSLIAIRKYLTTLPEDHPTKLKWSFLLK